jgi:hypothetical protein
MVTDFDCWHPGHDAVTVDAIIRVLLANAERGQGAWWRRLAGTVASPMRSGAGCGCRTALQHALITAPEARDPALVERCGRGRPRAVIRCASTAPMRTLWPAPGRDAVFVIDQRLLPHRLAGRAAGRRGRGAPPSATCGCAARR